MRSKYGEMGIRRFYDSFSRIVGTNNSNSKRIVDLLNEYKAICHIVKIGSGPFKEIRGEKTVMNIIQLYVSFYSLSRI